MSSKDHRLSTEGVEILLSNLRQITEERLNQLRSQLNTSQGAGHHNADDPTEKTMVEQYALSSQMQCLNQLLEQVRKALAAIKNGTYGICQCCGKQIDPERLRAIPYATKCLNCQTNEEQAATRRRR